MKTTTLWAAIVLAPIGAFFFGPQIMEGGSGPCAAFERAAYRNMEDPKTAGPFVLGFFAMSDGRVAATKVAERFPNVPPSVSCAGIYWVRTIQGGDQS